LEVVKGVLGPWGTYFDMPNKTIPHSGYENLGLLLGLSLAFDFGTIS